MTIPTIFKEYIWLIETIYRAGKISLTEINEKWRRTEESGGVGFARSTFNRHRDAILDMFGVIIDCDRKDGYRYFIYNKEVLRGDSVANWLYSTLSVSNMLEESVGIQDRILLESVPSGDEHLQKIIKAMRENRKIMITYHRYRTESSNSYSVEPYCVKLFKRRWYVLVKMERSHRDENGKVMKTMAVFSIDRIENIEIQKEKFKVDKDFDAAEYFGDCFGIVVSDDTPKERIILRAYGLEPYYLRDLPLHQSQKEIKVTDEYTDFELTMRPTADFMAHLMSRGEWLRVISPQWLAEEMQNWLQAALKKYKTEEK